MIDLRTELDALTVSNTNLATQVADLNKTVTEQNKTVAEQAVKLHVHTERAENLANRALRKTIEIRGIPETVEETTWDATRSVAAEAIAAATGIPTNNVGDMFERIHRGPKSDRPNNQYPRKIYASVHNWNHINVLTTALRLHGRNSGIYIDQKYGPDTSFRRTQAFNKRRELKESQTIVSGYVKYPAKLFVKYRKGDAKYVPYDDYSTIPIPDEVYNK